MAHLCIFLPPILNLNMQCLILALYSEKSTAILSNSGDFLTINSISIAIFFMTLSLHLGTLTGYGSFELLSLHVSW